MIRPEVMPVEIKAGATVTSDWLKGLRAFSERLPSSPSSAALVYGGNEMQRRSEATVWLAWDVARMMAELEAGAS